MNAVDWTVIGCGVLLVGVAMLSGWIGGRWRGRISDLRSEISEVKPLVLVRARAPLSEEQMRGIARGWAENDERWMLLEDLFWFYQEQAMLQAAEAAVQRDAGEQAHAMGAVLALHQLQAALRQLREEAPGVRTERRRGA
jgi:hypothetical protein